MEVAPRHAPQGYSPAQPKAQGLRSHRGACGDKLFHSELLSVGVHWCHLEWRGVCHRKHHARRTGLQERASPSPCQPHLPAWHLPFCSSHPAWGPQSFTPDSLPPVSLPPVLHPLCSFQPKPPIATALLCPGCPSFTSAAPRTSVLRILP